MFRSWFREKPEFMKHCAKCGFSQCGFSQCHVLGNAHVAEESMTRFVAGFAGIQSELNSCESSYGSFPPAALLTKAKLVPNLCDKVW